MQNKALRNWAGIVTGLLLFVLFLLINPFDLSNPANRVMAVAVLMVSWWVSEAIPMAMVALLPLVLFPLLGIAPIKTTANAYGDSILFLFLGGFMIGLAIEKWHLHKRIALTIVHIMGSSGDRIILGFILSTGVLSMWLSNTATTMMMFPIAVSVIHVFKENRAGEGNVKNFSISVLLSIAYASNFGGIATIIGTPPNVAFVGYISEKYNYSIQFTQWMAIGIPISFLLLLSLYFVLTKWLFPNRFKADHNTGIFIKEQLQELGPMRVTEKRVMVIFVCTALLWITKDLINATGLIRLDDTIIALLGAFALFVVPSGVSGRILEWPDTTKVAWGIILLFGGGIALAGALEKAGLIESLGNWVAASAGTGDLSLVFIITVVSMFVSELMSNIAQVIVFAPVIGGIADAMNLSPILLGIPMTLAASCASMMPMGTPPNAIVFGSGQISLMQMIKVGLVMNIIAIILITFYCWFIVPLIFQV